VQQQQCIEERAGGDMDNPPDPEEAGYRPFGANGIFGVGQRLGTTPCVRKVRRVELVARRKQEPPAAWFR
jgi:hypothetical protein